VVEYAGPAIEALTMEGRMTVCNMTIEGGGRAGMVAPDETTFEWVIGRPAAPREVPDEWRTLRTDPGASFDREITVPEKGGPPEASSVPSRTAAARPGTSPPRARHDAHAPRQGTIPDRGEPVMRTVRRLLAGASLIALAVGLFLAARPASAQTPAPAPAVTAPAPVPAPAAPAAPRLTTPAANPAMVAAPRVATVNPRTNAVRAQARVYTVPAQGASSTKQSQHLSWPTRRFSPLARPWLSPN
jgi:hypothetical protein